MDVKNTVGEPRVLISRSAILHNARLLRRTIGNDVKICAVVKADAYGHGAKIVADTLANFTADESERPAVDAFAVATIDEAADLPATDLPVTILRPIENIYLGRQRDALEYAVRHGWILTLDTPAAADDVARVAVQCGRRAMINVMLDVGMSRGGVSMSDLPRLVARIGSHPSLKLLSIGTHFSSSERMHPDPLNVQQLRMFRAATDDLVQGPDRHLKRHAANSGAIFFSADSHLDQVRPGISLYGIDPTMKPSLDRPLRPVLRWTAPIIGIRGIPRGTAVGYNETWIARRDSRIGLIPVGYADGYIRAFSNRAQVIVQDRTCPVVGRVSMDLTTIDLTDVPNAGLGDEVTLLDSDPMSPASVYRLASIGNTIPYEIFTHIGQRVRRVADELEEDPERSEFGIETVN